MDGSKTETEKREGSHETGKDLEKSHVGPIIFRDLLVSHFPSCALESLVVTRHDFPVWMRADLQRELEKMFADLPGHRFYGVRFRGGELDFRFPNLLETGDDAIAVGPVVYHDVNIGEAAPVRCLLRALWLAELEGTPFGLLLDLSEHYHGTRLRLEVAVAPGADAESVSIRLFQRLRRAGDDALSFRGKVLQLEQDANALDGAPPCLVVSNVAQVSREDIVLPAKILDLIERNTLGFGEHANSLVGMGMSARKGVLLYGPPGTGKTMVARYIAGKLTGFTKFLVSGSQYGMISECLKIARTLQPSVIVLEDVDLIGANRDGPFQSTPQALNNLLNEMDGFNSEAKILVIMTTNRTEMLEPALSGRPGRVDQSIEMGLPDDAERRTLIRRYAGPLAVEDGLVASTSKRLGKVSPAFIRELMRRAAQSMLERSGEDTVLAEDLERALGDMLVLGGSLNAKLLNGESSIGFAMRG